MSRAVPIVVAIPVLVLAIALAPDLAGGLGGSSDVPEPIMLRTDPPAAPRSNQRPDRRPPRVTSPRPAQTQPPATGGRAADRPAPAPRATPTPTRARKAVRPPAPPPESHRPAPPPSTGEDDDDDDNDDDESDDDDDDDAGEDDAGDD